MSFRWRLGVSSAGWQELTSLIWSQVHRFKPCPQCTIYALYVARSALSVGFDMRPSYCPSVGACEMGWWAHSHNALSPPYTDRDPILSGETKPLWTRPPGHGGCAQICLCLPIDPTQIYQYGTFEIAQGLRSHIDLVRIDTHNWTCWSNSTVKAPVEICFPCKARVSNP